MSGAARATPPHTERPGSDAKQHDWPGKEIPSPARGSDTLLRLVVCEDEVHGDGAVVWWEVLGPNTVPKRALVNDVLPVLCRVSTLTGRGLLKKPCLVDADSTMTSNKLVQEKVALYFVFVVSI
ncbi:hypothetical protein CDAR_57021 [Caerostris darwini]|uniref:Uncharacterized protein n=1 Tax=Caerostris darwini TaxID=1538125 RepID=A0AAV4WBC5_9ARAC|nr:hypothetical protein CDAR_57021 [Caerostris darwini]